MALRVRPRLGLRLRRGFIHLLYRLRALSRVDDKTWFVLLVVAVGLLAALISRAGNGFAELIQFLALGGGGSYVTLVRRANPWLVALLPCAGGLVFGLLLYWRRRRPAGEGLAEIMEAVSVKGTGTLRLRNVLPKFVASLVLNATGGSVGREGPVAQTGAAAASSLGRAVKLPAHRLRVLVGCGVAAGMAVTYDAPVGAAFFAMEVLFGNFALDVFGPLVVASAVATLAAHPALMSEPLFPAEGAALNSPWELVACLAVGCAAALGSRAMTRTLSLAEASFGRLRLARPLRVALGGLGVGLLATQIPEVWGNGRVVVRDVLAGGLGWRLLLLLVAGKILATSLSLGSGGAGGIFTPTLLVGASIGVSSALGLSAAAPGLIGEPGAYGVAGMAGALAALTHAPVTGFLMVFDMTRDYGLLVPIMLASVAGTLVARGLESRSMYADRLRRRGIDLDMAFEDLALGSLRAADLMRPAPPTVKGDEDLRTLLRRFGECHENQLVALDAGGRPVGVIDLRDVVEYSQDVAAGQILLALDLARFVEPVTVITPLSAAMERIWRLDSALLPVVDPARGGRLAGVLARKDLLNAFDREMLRKRLLLSRFLAARAMEGQPAEVPAGEDYILVEQVVPAHWVGKSLAELELPADRRVLVVAMRRGEGAAAREIMPPPADMPLKDGDRLVLLGHRHDVEGIPA